MTFTDHGCHKCHKCQWKYKVSCPILKEERELPKMRLCGNNLPWVESGKHQGNTIENKLNAMQLDMKQKKAQYITKNNDQIQEFHFFHPSSLIRNNQIQNSHFTRSQLWDLFSEEAIKVENTWKKSIRLILDIPLSTHRGWLSHYLSVYMSKKCLWKDVSS